VLILGGLLGGYSYPVDGVDQLYGAVQAAINMKKCLLEHLGFKEKNIILNDVTNTEMF